MTGGQCAFGTQCFTLESEGSLDYQPATTPHICVYQYLPFLHIPPFYCQPRLRSARRYFLILTSLLLFEVRPKKRISLSSSALRVVTNRSQFDSCFATLYTRNVILFYLIVCYIKKKRKKNLYGIHDCHLTANCKRSRFTS